MIPHVTLSPNCLALKFKIYSDKFTDTDSLDNCRGYCLVIFQGKGLYYVKKTVNLKNYLIKMHNGITKDHDTLAQCMQNVLSRYYGSEPVIYYLEDSNDSTIHQIHNMLSNTGWVNMITPRGDRIDKDRDLCLARTNYGIYFLVSKDPKITCDDVKDYALATIKKKLMSMSNSPRFMSRIKNQYNHSDVNSLIKNLSIVNIIETTNNKIPLSKVTPLISAYNGDVLNAWAGAPAWSWNASLVIRDIYPYINKFLK